MSKILCSHNQDLAWWMNIPQESEIVWEELTKIAFNQILDEQDRWLGRNIWISFRNIQTSLMVRYSDEKFDKLIEEKFEICPPDFEAMNRWSIFFIESPMKPARGFICGNAIIVFGHWFWIFKSIVNGMATYVNHNLLPMHAWVIDTNRGWIVFAWWHAAGKTTTVINAMEIFDKQWLEPSLLSDDWVGARIQAGGLTVDNIDNSLSLNSKTSHENPDLRVFSRIEKTVLEDRKVSFNPAVLYSQEAIQSTKIKVIVLLLWPYVWAEVSGVDIPGFLVDSAYHYPYTEKTKNWHKEVWARWLQWLSVWLYSREVRLKTYLKQVSQEILSLI